MRKPFRILVTLGLLGGASACSLFIGSLDECKVDADCASKGAGLVCQDQLCVVGEGGGDAGADAGADAGPAVLRDPLCQSLFGAVDGGAGVLRFGAVVPKTTSSGAADQRGVLREHALQLAVEQLNKNFAIPNHPVALRVCDDTGDSAKAANEAQELLDEGAVALVTTGSSQTIAIADKGVPAGAVMMAISATSTQIASAGVLPDGGAKRVWSTATSDALQGRVLASMLAGTAAVNPPGAPFQAPACLHQDDVAFDLLYNTIRQDLAADTDGGLLMPQALYASGADPTSAVQQTMAGSPDAVVVIAPVGDSARIFGAWTGADPVWLFTDNSRNTSLYAFDGGLARLQGSLGTGPATASAASTEYNDFQTLYLTEFSTDPASASYVPNAYDAVLLLGAGAVWSADHGGVTGAGIAQGLGKLSQADAGSSVSLEANQFTTLQAAFAQGRAVNVSGASGALDFDPATGVAPGPIDVWTIAPDGGIVTLQTVTP